VTRVAAIDCGTNSIRLLVADVDPVRRTLTDADRRLEIVRLGQGVDKTGRLAPEALERTLRGLRDYARIIRASHVDGVRMVATSATRDAANAAEFTRGVVEVLGGEPEVLTGDEEERDYLWRAINRMAEHTKRGQISALWFIPVDMISFSQFLRGATDMIKSGLSRTSV